MQFPPLVPLHDMFIHSRDRILHNAISASFGEMLHYHTLYPPVFIFEENSRIWKKDLLFTWARE